MAIIERSWEGSLRERLRSIYERYSPARGFQQYNLADELTQQRLFNKRGEQRCGPEPRSPTVEEYLECRHSQRSFSGTHMGAEAADAFDAEVRHALEHLTAEGAIATRDSRSLSLPALYTGVNPAAENHDVVLDRSTNFVGLDAGVPLQLSLNVVPNLFVSAGCFGCDHLSTMRQGL